MEFIPIKRKPKRNQIKKSVKSTKIKTKTKNDTEDKCNKKLKKTNKVRNKRETVKKNKKKIIEALDSENGTDEEENDKIIEDESLDESEPNNEKKDYDENDDDDDIGTKEEKTFAQKCQMMDEKKKNRLFVKFKKKIHSEAVVKELHPDIRGVIFPRKKKPRWCWAVFASEEKADQALKALSKKKDILVNKPNPYDQVYKKQQKKLQTVIRKKEARKKFVEMWT